MPTPIAEIEAAIERGESVYIQPNGVALFGAEARRAQRPTIDELQKILDGERDELSVAGNRRLAPPTMEPAGWAIFCGDGGQADGELYRRKESAERERDKLSLVPAYNHLKPFSVQPLYLAAAVSDSERPT